MKKPANGKKEPTPTGERQKKSCFRWIGDALFYVLTLICGAGLVVAAKSSLISPDKVSLCAYPNYCFLPLLLCNAICLIHWIRHPSFRMMVPIACIALCSKELLIWFPVHFQESEAGLGKEVKVLTYNTMQFASCQKPTPGHPNPVLQYINDSDADIVALQEGGWMQTPESITKKEILTGLKKYPHHIRYSYMGTSNLWIFSRYPIVNHDRLNYETETNGSIYCDINIDGRPVRVFNNHLESNKLTVNDKALYKSVIRQHDKESISQAAQQINSKLRPASTLRARQADKLSQYIRLSPYPVIVCGDFNDIPSSYTFRTVSEGLNDAWTTHNNGLGITFHEGLYRFRIDYIMHSPSLKSLKCHIDKVDASDHYPLWAVFQLNQ